MILDGGSKGCGVTGTATFAELDASSRAIRAIEAVLMRSSLAMSASVLLRSTYWASSHAAIDVDLPPTAWDVAGDASLEAEPVGGPLGATCIYGDPLPAPAALLVVVAELGGAERAGPGDFVGPGEVARGGGDTRLVAARDAGTAVRG